MFIIKKFLRKQIPMSLIELFKQHVPQAHHWHNPLAGFYAGFMGHSMDVHIWHELHDCIEQGETAEEALFFWGEALHHLSRGEKDEFKADSTKATELSKTAMASCHENGKFAVIDAEMTAWFTDFWTQEGAIEQMMENIEAHPFKVKLDMLAMRASWAVGFYYGAGSSYGRFWKHLMGKPTWSADMSSPKMAATAPENNPFKK